jgi:hypothetical protein
LKSFESITRPCLRRDAKEEKKKALEPVERLIDKNLFKVLLRLSSGTRAVLEMLMYRYVPCAFFAPLRATPYQVRQTLNSFY